MSRRRRAAARVGDGKALHDFSSAIVRREAELAYRHLDLAERAVRASLQFLPETGPWRRQTLARIHYWRGE